MIDPIMFFSILFVIGLILIYALKPFYLVITRKKQAIMKAKEIIEEAERKAKRIIENAERKNKYVSQQIELLDKLAKEKLGAIPYFANLLSDYLVMHYQESAQYLDSKSHPAHKEASRIRELQKETREYIYSFKTLQYRMDYLESLYPNIYDVFDYNPSDEPFELETDETTDRVRYYLTPEEYSILSSTEKNQLALDRYVEGRKSKWQIGRDYEMYIGRCFEQKGYSVAYTGIIKNLEDMGRDLIATKGENTYIVQCKNWSQDKNIHEKHVFQLYGTVVLEQLQSEKKICGVFVASNELSQKAKDIAEFLKIKIYEKIPLKNFPRIKCNINATTGEWIYHLPFDQQYDTTIIDKERGEFYALTVKEAEENGFRRAFKHIMRS